MNRRATLSLVDWRPDVEPSLAPEGAATDARNVLFRDNELTRSPGEGRTLQGVTGRVLAARFATVAGGGVWLVATTDGVFAHDGSAVQDVTPAGGWPAPGPDEVFTATAVNGFPVINGSQRDPIYWPLAGVCAVLPNWPAGLRCYAMRAHLGFLFAIGCYSENEQRVRWSDSADPGAIPDDWTPGGEDLAGFVDLADDIGPALDGRDLRGEFIIYKRHAVYSFAFVDSNDVFIIRRRFARAGIAGVNALAVGPDDRHLFLASDGDAYVTDGVELRSVLDGRANRWLYRERGENGERAGFHAGTVRREKVALLAFPTAGERYATRGLVFDWETLAIGPRDLAEVSCIAEGGALGERPSETWEELTRPWSELGFRWNDATGGETSDDMLLGMADGPRIWGLADDMADGPVKAFAEKRGIAFGDARRRVEVVRLWPRMRGEPGARVLFRAGGQETADGPVALSAEVEHEIGSGRPVDLFAQGRFFSVQIRSDGGPAWALSGVDVEFQERGRW